MSGLHHKRAYRVAQLLKHELSALTVQGLKDPRVGLVTVTEVRLSDDLKTAQVFVSVLGDEDARNKSLVGLNAASGFLRHEVTHRLQLRFAPTLYFQYDNSLARAQRLDALLGAAARGKTEMPEAQAGKELPPVDTGRTVRTLAGPSAPETPAKPARRKPARKRSGRTTRSKSAGPAKK